MARHTQRDCKPSGASAKGGAADALANDARAEADLVHLARQGFASGYQFDHAAGAVWLAKQTAHRRHARGDIPEIPAETILRAALLLLDDVREHVRERETV